MFESTLKKKAKINVTYHLIYQGMKERLELEGALETVWADLLLMDFF